MFFLGIAGSIMPCLLFLGALFVFTMEVIANTDAEPISSSEKTINYQNPSLYDYTSVKDCYVYTCNEKVHTQQTSRIAFAGNDYHIVEHNMLYETQACFTNLNYRSELVSTYFGLSPPCLLS